MGLWTIQYSGTEKPTAAWGLNAAPVLRLRTQSAAQFSFLMAAADPAGALPFPFEAPVTIRQNRIAVGTAWADDGSDNHFVFQGRLISPTGNISGTRQDVQLMFQDPWYDLENIPYQQLWNIFGGTGLFSRAYLFFTSGPPGTDAPPSYLTVAQQITQIITYAAAAGANIQAGTITGGSQMPWYAVRGLSCAGAIKKCLECFPDLITWVDGSTTPPTFNCVYRGALEPVTLPYKGVDTHGRAHKSSQIRARYDLLPSGVVMQYQQNFTEDGETQVQLTTDAYPEGFTGQALRAIVCPIDLRGGSASYTHTQITTRAFDPTDVVSFWQVHVKSLTDADIVGTPTLVDTAINDGAHPYGIGVLDSAGNPIDYADLYPVEMIRPSKWAAWTGVNVIEATVTAYLTFSKARKIGTATVARPTNEFPHQLHTVKIKLCNAPLGTTPYTTENTYDSGETPVAGLAAAIYSSLAQLQFEGHHEIIEQRAVSEIIGPWNVLNLTGGNAAWVAMNANIPEVEIDFFRNVTRLTIGPAKHLSPQDLNNYLQFFRARVMWDNAQITGGKLLGASVDQSGDVPEEDSNSSHPQEGLVDHRAPDAVTPASTNTITHDPANGQIQIQQFDAAGAPAPAAGMITAKIGDLADAANKAASFQWVSMCDSAGNSKKCKVLSTVPE